MPAELIYLDWNATSPLHPTVVAAMQRAAEKHWGNPSSVHAAGRGAASVVEGVREQLAALLGTHHRDVLFTAGGTEANNLALHDTAALVLARIEHPSVTQMGETAASRGAPVVWVPVGASGCVEPEAVQEALESLPSEMQVTVCVTAVNHETGIIQDVTGISEVSRRFGARLHVDAVQALGKVSLDFLAGVDSLAVSAHKIRGPKGVGALLWRDSSSAPRPLLIGGAQQRGLRAGTLDPVTIAGFGAALERSPDGPERYSALASLRDRLQHSLGDRVRNNGDATRRVPHVLNVSVNGWRGDEMVAALDLLGICVSSGSACSAGTPEPSPVITEMLGVERAKEAVRISLGDEITDEIMSTVIPKFVQVLGAEPSST
ncbi:MAG: cysteine desulfurase [Polyangiaceae bacterium]|nr:cysteine desulfurase [Polyangiaceae bacterium]